MEKQKADQIITEYMQRLYGFAMKKAYSYDEAEELCAEIIKEVYISLRRAGEIVNLEGYVWRISEHTYARYVSARKGTEAFPSTVWNCCSATITRWKTRRRK